MPHAKRGYYFKAQHRLKNFDYSSSTSYFLTFNTRGGQKILSTIRKAEDSFAAELTLTPIGEIVDKHIRRIEECYAATLDAYVIMPNHVHLLITVHVAAAADAQVNSAVARIVRSTKTMITKELGQKIWQDDYYDVIADSDRLYDRCWDYIRDNPGVWLQSGAEPVTILSL